MEYRTIAALVGLGCSTVREIVLDACDAIACHLMPHYIRILQGDNLRDVVHGFERCWGFLQTVGAIDGYYIPIIKPQESVGLLQQERILFSLDTGSVGLSCFYRCQHWLARKGRHNLCALFWLL